MGKHVWTAKIQRDDGQVFERQIVAAWSPEKDFVTDQSVAQAAACEAFIAGNKQHRYMGISATLVE